MGYYMTAIDDDLKCERDISRELMEMFRDQKLSLKWEWGHGYVGLEEGYFKWCSDVLRDFMCLKDMGVRGYLTCRGEQGEYYKYLIDDDGIKEYLGYIVFPEEPEAIYRSIEDVPEC